MSSGFFKKFFSKKEVDSSELFWIYTQCDKCGEKFKTLIRKNNDIAPTYKNEGPAFILRKEFNRVHPVPIGLIYIWNLTAAIGKYQKKLPEAILFLKKNINSNF